ncbi:MAG: hypothetical protein HC897_12770 [Thermoanaerobaculia bacterium]|nr:hypothetical protein [Thermoanaerobaculia bacterium]
MTTFPRSPRLLRGAIITVEIYNPLSNVIVFQYNPETLSRSLEARRSSQGGSRAEALRLYGAPQETIDAEIMIDATDQLEKRDASATRRGIYPQLAALESLLYPPTLQVIANTVLAQLGTIEISPPQAPLTLFAWGARRIVPVNIEKLSITEEAYDVNLNPIRAKVSLSLRVLTYDDLPVTSPGYALYLAHQAAKEALAIGESTDNRNSILRGETRII